MMTETTTCNIEARTAGNGLWSSATRKLTHRHMELRSKRFEGDEWGELRVYFTKRDWDVNKHGLVYSDGYASKDTGWIYDFRGGLRAMGFTRLASLDVNYSEQGMQGDNYVSLDADKRFIREFTKMAR